jgi:hypothetical protein
MKKFLSIASASVLFIAVSAFTVGQTPTPADVGENARRQAADAAFADAERRLTVQVIEKAIAQADQDTKLIGDITAASKALADRLKTMKTSDEGRQLAASLDEISAGQVQELIDQPPVLPEVVAAIQKEVDSTTADLKKLHNNPPAGFVPPDQLQDELVKDRVTLSQMLAKLKERDGWLTSQVLAAPRSIDLTKIPTLEAALADFKSRQQQAWNAAQRKGIEEAKPAALDQITENARKAEMERSLQHANALLDQSHFDAEQAKINFDMQLKQLRDQKEQEVAEVNRKLAESEAKRTVENAKSDVIRQQGNADAAKLLLVQKCQDPNVKEILAPFLTSGLWQPGDQPGHPWLHERGPVSLKALKAVGALEPTERGLTTLYIDGNATYIRWPYQKHPDTERTKWGYPGTTARFQQKDWEDIREAQHLLNELGDTLVEQKMLAP